MKTGLEGWTVWLLVSAVSLVSGGCQVPASAGPSQSNTELARKEEELAKARQQADELYKKNYELSVQLKQAQETIDQLKGRKPGVFEYKVTKVGFGFLTAAVNWDDQPGTDGIQAFVYLEDQFGESIKRAAALRLEMFAVSDETGKLIQTWTFTPEASAKYWQVIPAGYMFKLPFQSGAPKAGQVLLKATVTLTEGGTFEATRIVRIPA